MRIVGWDGVKERCEDKEKSKRLEKTGRKCFTEAHTI